MYDRNISGNSAKTRHKNTDKREFNFETEREEDEVLTLIRQVNDYFNSGRSYVDPPSWFTPNTNQIGPRMYDWIQIGRYRLFPPNDHYRIT